MTESTFSEREQELIQLGMVAELMGKLRAVVKEETAAAIRENVPAVVRDEVESTLSRYYGNRTPEQVLHNTQRSEKFFGRLDEISSSFWRTSMLWALRYGFMVALLGWVFINSGYVKPPIDPNAVISP